MPKKIHTNPKAEAARERKDEVKKAKKTAAENAKVRGAKYAGEAALLLLRSGPLLMVCWRVCAVLSVGG